MSRMYGRGSRAAGPSTGSFSSVQPDAPVVRLEPAQHMCKARTP